MNQTSVVTRTGTLSIPEHLRRPGSFFQHGAKVQILEDPAANDPRRVKIRLDGYETNMEKKFVVESPRI